jgi:hypothetical protein
MYQHNEKVEHHEPDSRHWSFLPHEINKETAMEISSRFFAGTRMDGDYM